MVSGKGTSLQNTASINYGIMAQPNTNRDNAGTDERHLDDTSEGMRREILLPKIKLQATFGQQHQSIHEQLLKMQEGNKEQNMKLFSNRGESAEYAHLISRNTGRNGTE